MIRLPLKIKYVTIFCLFNFLVLSPYLASELADHLRIKILVDSCYTDFYSCSKVLLKINNLQNNAAKNKNFSCQTRLLGLEANLIMAMNSDFKRTDAKNIINDVKKYC